MKPRGKEAIGRQAGEGAAEVRFWRGRGCSVDQDGAVCRGHRDEDMHKKIGRQEG